MRLALAQWLVGSVMWSASAVASAQAATQAPAQKPPAATPTASAPTAPIERQAPPDPQVDAVLAFIGRGTFLRCFCTENNLAFDANGRPLTSPHVADWTLSAINITKAERKSPNLVEVEGVRVAIRYNPDNREFQRHAQNDDKMHLQIADIGDPRQFARALDTIIAQGIDPRLQHATPDYWQHYFNPKLDWPADALTNEPIYVAGPGGFLAGAPPDAKPGPPVTPATVLKRAEPAYTGFAQRDHVKGTTQLRMVVDAEGVPRRIAIVMPLGYGLDENAAQSAAKLRFTPAMREGKPVASTVLLNQEFELVGLPR